MPPKRKAQDSDARAVENAAPAKRQRVSRACDQCRSAREKCDGTKPQCFSCISLGRDCTYNVTPKKRGVQTGLIRTLESALVWVFEQFPGAESALNDLLAQENGPNSLSIGNETDTGNRLHRRWRRSKTRKEIDRLLAGKDGSSPRQDASEEDESSTEPDHASDPPDTARRTPHADAATQPTRRSFRLPAGFSRLLDIYFAYTHCWLPILDKGRILGLASSHQGKEVKDSELWCALAVAAYQDPTAQSCPLNIYSKARSLLPLVGDDCPDQDTSDGGNERTDTNEGGRPGFDAFVRMRAANGFLLLSLIKFGRDDALAASLLVGLSARTSLGLGHNTGTAGAPQASTQRSRTLMACFFLDTLVSLRLGQLPHITAGSLAGVHALPEEGSEEWDSWSPLPGFAFTDETSESRDTLRSIQSLSSFNQLCKFAQVLGNVAVDSSAKSPSTDLAAALDPRFSFCNSILGGSTPYLPTAFLLQATFLSATLALTPDARVSLVWALMEAVEHSWEHLGPGVSPLLVTYMSMASRRTRGLGSEDKKRWDSLLAKLKSTWHQKTGSSTANRPASSSSQGQVSNEQQPFHQALMTPPDPFQAQVNNGTTTATTTTTTTATRALPSFGPSNNHMHGFQGDAMSPLTQVPPYLLLQGHSDPMIDHDAILDELASIDCNDSMDADPQFMANLGFAPGSDFTDMRGEFGAL